MRLTRFHIAFFSVFALIGLLMIAMGDIEHPAAKTRAPEKIISPVTLAKRLVEGRKDFLVADWMDKSYISECIRIHDGDDPVAKLDEATGEDTSVTVVVLAEDSEIARKASEALRDRGYSVELVRGGAKEWRRQVLDANQASPDIAAVSRYIRGVTKAPAASDTPAPVAVPVAPRRRSIKGGGC